MIDSEGRRHRYSLAVSADGATIHDDEAVTPSTAVVESFDRDHLDEAERRVEALNEAAEKPPARSRKK